ncbi:MAG: hypothetical protein JWQ07_209 [Ramlibacter sp.]|nr:hypothetical protein [Ramlibacter sp.]
MKTFSHSLALVAGAAVLVCAGAASAAISEAQARYQRERAACMNGTSNQDRATCLKEAGAAWQEAKRAGLGTSGDGSLARNQLARCEALPAQDREDCALRMQQGTTSGSAQQGGVLRESTSPVRTP